MSIDPRKLDKYNLTPSVVLEAVTDSNLNVGGDVIEKSGQAYVVRGIGLVKSIADIENITVHNDSGNPILVKYVADVHQGSFPSCVQDSLDNVVVTIGGIVVMAKD